MSEQQYTVRYILDGTTKEKTYYCHGKNKSKSVEKEFTRYMHRQGYGWLDKRNGSRWKIIAIVCD